jgi:N4-(beta-N-acetylglucosaminyl)-L-asparaginase
MSVSRRDFLAAGATAAASAAFGAPLFAEGAAGSAVPVEPRAFARPLVIASANGIRGVKRAYDMIVGGSDTLDAIIAGVNIQELDPEDMSVGLGGLPNEDGVVQLDASCMHGPTMRAGAVGCLEDIATPSLVAKAVMDYTDHVMLVGPDAKNRQITRRVDQVEDAARRERHVARSVGDPSTDEPTPSVAIGNTPPAA